MKLFSKLEIALKKLSQIRSKRKLRKTSELWNFAHEYHKKTESTGFGSKDFLCLFEIVRATKPARYLSLVLVPKSFVKLCTKYDLRSIANSIFCKNFANTLRLFGVPELSITEK